MNQFVCTDCGRDHIEPVDATFVLAVRCTDCDLTIALAARRLAISPDGASTAALAA